MYMEIDKMTLTKLIHDLKNSGKDICELDAILTGFQEAQSLEDVEYYQNQIYGILVGMTILQYINKSTVMEIMANLENSEI